MRRRVKPKPPALVVVDASLLLDDVAKRHGGAARGLVDELAKVCFHFALSADLRKEYEACRKLMRTHILLAQVLGRIYSKRIDLDRLIEPLPQVDLGSWDRQGDDHLLQLSRAAKGCPCLTSERANVAAKGVVKAALGIEVLDADAGWKLAHSRPPCTEQD